MLTSPTAAAGTEPRTALAGGRDALRWAVVQRYRADALPIRAVAREARYSYATIRDLLLDTGIPLRPAGRGRRSAPAAHGPRRRLRIGYSMWGFLTAGVLDTPDGSRSYRRQVIDEIQATGHEVVLLQANRDVIEAGMHLSDRYRFDTALPNLDAVVFEWRWPLPGRNTTPCGSAGHTCDLHRQQELLDHYTIGLDTPTVIWDLDRRLAPDDPLRTRTNVRVAEYALRPTLGAFTLACPVPDQLLDEADPRAFAIRPRPLPLVYVGNQYDRDDAFGTYFAPAAAELPHRVAGKWPRTDRWPHVRFTGRCRFDEVAGIHATALATVLLLPPRYRGVGHQTSRLFEAVTQGCLPLTPADTVDAAAFTPPQLHVRDGADVLNRIRWLQTIAGSREHRDLITACLLSLQRYRLSCQVPILLDVLGTLAGDHPPPDASMREANGMTLTPAEYDRFGDAYVAVLRRILERPDYQTRGRGKDAIEVPNITFRLTDPTQRSAYLAARKANIVFNWAEALWYLTGRSDLAMIGHYAPQLRALSADATTLTGTAYGPRLFRPGHDGLSQFDRVIDLLRQDPDSKRATMLIMRPDELTDPANPDVACTLALQFLLRGGRLHATAYMRGNDAVVGLLCDTFSFTVIQEFAARQLAVPVGTYTHHVGSMHINLLDTEKVKAILTESSNGPAPVFPTAVMPPTSVDDLATVLRWEEGLRTRRRTLTAAEAADVPVPGYWRQVLLLFEAYRQIQHTTSPITADITAALTPGNRWLLAARWPDRITAAPPSDAVGRPS